MPPLLCALVGCGEAIAPPPGTAPSHADASILDVQSSSLNVDDAGALVVVSLSDFGGSVGCSSSLNWTPAAAGQQVVLTLLTAAKICPSGVYPIGLNQSGARCDPLVECAEVRAWSADGAASARRAGTGTVTVAQAWVDPSTADCTVDVDLTMDGERLAHSFTVRVDQSAENAPYCD